MVSYPDAVSAIEDHDALHREKHNDDLQTAGDRLAEDVDEDNRHRDEVNEDRELLWKVEDTSKILEAPVDQERAAE